MAPPERRQQADAVARVLETRLEALVDRSIEIARRNGYAPFTTTIRAAWVEAIVSVTESLGAYLGAGRGGTGGPLATLDYGHDPRFARMRHIARLHRSLGITLQMYTGLFKHFRNIYMAELGAAGLDARDLLARVRDFFDETELSITADWTHSDDNHRLRELQERTRALTLDKDRYFAIFESLRNPAFLLDRQQHLVNANQAAAELFLGDAHAGDIIYLRSMRRKKSALDEVVGHILAATQEPDSPVWLDTLSGRRCFDVRMRALHDAVQNIAIGHVLLLNDVTTHRRATEEARESERGMSRYLATMSHEIRTPLHSVLGATELLRTADAAAAEGYLDVIETAGETLLETLNNVLDFSKLENETPAVRAQPVDLAAALNTFGRVAAVGRNRDRIPLAFEISPEVPCRVMIDWAMTRQVLGNLISNALRVDDGRGVEVAITAVATADAPGLRFEVRDHGPGIPPEAAAALFRPFDKTGARDTGNGGAGLGLAIAHHLVDAMAGRIGYRNRPPGALLWFEIPCQPAEPTEAAKDAPACLPDTAPERPRHCLLVDDDPIGALVTTRQLERAGLTVDRVTTVAGALDAAMAGGHDVFVVDYVLPDGTGTALVRTLKARLDGPRRFIALTANVEALDLRTADRGLFDTVLAKPVDKATLAAALLGTGPAPTAAPMLADRRRAPDLGGLSEGTLRAMRAAFQDAWTRFRATLDDPAARADTAMLADEAHRLAGSTATLGLHELEQPLRDLERRCRAEGPSADISVLVTRLDRDPTRLDSWARLLDMGPRR